MGNQLAENELQQNFSQDQQQLQDSQLAQKIFQQLNLAQHSFTEKTLHNKLATNFWNKAFQKNFLASKEVAENNFQDKQLVDSSFTKTAPEAFTEELLTACSPEASDNKQLFSTSLGQQSVAKAPSQERTSTSLRPCPGAPGEQKLLQRQLPEAPALQNRSFRQNSFSNYQLGRPRPSGQTAFQKQQLSNQQNFTDSSLEEQLYLGNSFQQADL